MKMICGVCHGKKMKKYLGEPKEETCRMCSGRGFIESDFKAGETAMTEELMEELKRDFGTEEACPKNENGHEPDWTAVTLCDDGEETYVDVPCVHCGRSGCCGSVRTLQENLLW